MKQKLDTLVTLWQRLGEYTGLEYNKVYSTLCEGCGTNSASHFTTCEQWPNEAMEKMKQSHGSTNDVKRHFMIVLNELARMLDDIDMAEEHMAREAEEEENRRRQEERAGAEEEDFIDANAAPEAIVDANVDANGDANVDADMDANVDANLDAALEAFLEAGTNANSEAVDVVVLESRMEDLEKERMEEAQILVEEEKRIRKRAEDIAHGMEADANEKQGEIDALKLQLDEWKAKEVKLMDEKATTSDKLVTKMEENEKLRAGNAQLSSGMGSLRVERDDSLARCAETESKKDKLEKENKEMKADLEVLRPKANERDYFFRELQAKKRSVVLLEDKLEQKVSDQKAEQTQHAKTLREKDKKISIQQGKITNHA